MVVVHTTFSNFINILERKTIAEMQAINEGLVNVHHRNEGKVCDKQHNKHYMYIRHGLQE